MTCYLYALPVAYEDILKLGISGDPLARARAFSRRYYESFDLSRSLLVEFDSRREAQARETELHRKLRGWNAVRPITVPDAAAGETEWYRGAYAAVQSALGEDAASGRIVHAPAGDWWRARLHGEREAVYEWGCQWLREWGEDGSPSAGGLRLLADALDAYAVLGLPLDDVLPPGLAQWYRGHRGG